MTLRNDWRNDPAARDAVAWRRDAAAAVGFTHVVEPAFRESGYRNIETRLLLSRS